MRTFNSVETYTTAHEILLVTVFAFRHCVSCFVTTQHMKVFCLNALLASRQYISVNKGEYEQQVYQILH